MAKLAAYRRKRNFTDSPEPSGRAGARSAQASFVVQLHHARSRHFDFRLEVDGVLRSWAVPKGPSLDPTQKRLAVEVEDHPLEYGKFEGDIPQGHYGAGHVDVWDKGQWTPEEGTAQAGLKKGHLNFELHGQRLRGRWSLIRTRFKGKQPQWLLIKNADEAQQKGDVADDKPLREWQGAPSRASAKKQMFPKDVGLQLARLSARAPTGDDWDHEVKYDGYRILMFRDNRTLKIISRNGVNYDKKLPAVLKALSALRCRQCVLDGELVALDSKGISSFNLLQQRFGGQGALQVIVFDLLYLDGRDLRGEPLSVRRLVLEKLLSKKPPAPLHRATHIQGNGTQAFAYACKQGIEGIVSKSRSAPYRAGRHGEWLKIKCTQSDEFVVVGYTQGQGSREAMGALLLARPVVSGAWNYVGRAGSGLGEALIRDLLKRAKNTRAPVKLKNLPSAADLKGAKVTWVQPKLVVEVVYRAITADGLLRQASLKGVREDKSVDDIRKQNAPSYLPPFHGGRKKKPLAPLHGAAKKIPARARGRAGVGEVYPFTHPERIIFEQPRITKAQLGAFYTDIAGQILKELSGRPLSLLRCPSGVGEICFFQKHKTPGFSADVKGGREYLYVEDLHGLLALVQMNAVEFHVWGCRVGSEDHPDRLVFDLDPADGVAWKRVIAAARRLRELLAGLKLESFVRTSGGKGLHVVAPLDGVANWDTAKRFTHAVAQTLAQESPDEFVDVANKARRKNKIFVDYLRNTRGATSVCSYSLRARNHAPLAMPLAWAELSRLTSGAQFTFDNCRERLKRKADPWHGIDDVKQGIPKI